MHLLFVGDTHGTQHLDKIKNMLPQVDIGPRDAIIHCGDIGVAWMGEEDDALRFWRSLPCRVLVCLGNHENFAWVRRQPLVTRHGCQGYWLGGEVFAPLPGETARLGGKSLWFYPGGYSIDFAFRRPGFSIYNDELLPTTQANAIIDRFLRRKGADYIISHDGPRSFITRNFGFPIGPPSRDYWNLMGEEEGARAHPAFVLDAIAQREDKFGRWYFGHHHRDAAEGSMRCLWNQAVLEDTLAGGIDVVDLPIAMA